MVRLRKCGIITRNQDTRASENAVLVTDAECFILDRTL